MKKKLVWLGIFLIVIDTILVGIYCTDGTPIHWKATLSPIFENPVGGILMLIGSFFLMSYYIWLIVIVWFVVSFIIKKTQRAESQLSKDAMEARGKIKNRMVILMVLYGFFAIVHLFVYSEYLDRNAPIVHSHLKEMLTAMGAGNLAVVAILLYIVSLPLLFHFKNIGRYLLFLSAILYIPEMISLAMNDCSLQNKPSVGGMLTVIIGIIILLFPIYYLTRSKVREQFK